MAIVIPESDEDIPLNCLDLEVAVAIGFDYRTNLIVPNVWWGLNFKHEIDVLVLTPANYAYEIEIKTSAGDLRRDFLKPHGHVSARLRKQFFAVPEKLVELTKTLVEKHRPDWGIVEVYERRAMRTIRHAKTNKAAGPFTDSEREHLYHLASMRTWTLKEVLSSKIKPLPESNAQKSS